MFPAMFPYFLSPPSWHTDVVFVRVLVAFNAVLEVADTFLDALAPDLLGSVLMATVAGIPA